MPKLTVEGIGEFAVPSGKRLVSDRVPDLDVVIQARRGQELAVGAERHAEDAVRVPFEGQKFLAGHGVPEDSGHFEPVTSAIE